MEILVILAGFALVSMCILVPVVVIQIMKDRRKRKQENRAKIIQMVEEAAEGLRKQGYKVTVNK